MFKDDGHKGQGQERHEDEPGGHGAGSQDPPVDDQKVSANPQKKLNPVGPGGLGRKKSDFGFQDKRLKKRLPAQTGPRTEKGKAAVSQNAVKLGLYARQVEDDAFVELERSIIESLKPYGAIQEGIVRSIVFEMWRLRGMEATVRRLEQGINKEQVNLLQLADQVGFPFSKEYAPLLLMYQNEWDLLGRVRSHCEDLFASTMAHAEFERAMGQGQDGSGSRLTALELANERAVRMLEVAKGVLSKDTLVQAMEEKFFQEFDAVMLDARLGNNSLGSELNSVGDLAPLVECWVYRNHPQVRAIAERMLSSLRLDLLTDPRIERALKSARSRLNSLLRDYVIEAPDKLKKARLLGFWNGEGY